jgi:transposase-like protein
MSTLNPRTTCPICSTFAAVHSRPHCITASCRWNFCNQCGWTYDRITGSAFIQRQAPALCEYRAAA